MLDAAEATGLAAQLDITGPVAGALVMARSARVDQPPVILAHDKLHNSAAERTLAWIPYGTTVLDLSNALALADEGTLVLVEEGPGAEPAGLQAVVAEHFTGSRRPRVVIGTPEQVAALALAGLEELARRADLPPVVMLGTSALLQMEGEEVTVLFLST